MTRREQSRFGWGRLLVAAAVLGAATWLTAPPAHAVDPLPPARPAGADLGAPGPCASAVQSLPNPSYPSQTVWVYQPQGSGRPRVGGTCSDSSRPVVLLAHGWSATDPAGYGELIGHLVSNGHIVVFPNFTTSYDPPLMANQVDAGFQAGVALTTRDDLSRIGVVGHSMGGGMTPIQMQRAASRGWGANALWAVHLTMHYAYGLPAGPIDLPAHARVLVIGGDVDAIVDNAIGIEVFRSIDLPAARKQHLTLRSSARGATNLTADHSLPFGQLDAIGWYGVLRPIDALSTCALRGQNCAADLSSMGTWSDGVAALAAVSTDTPADVGPLSLWECWNVLFNPRPCP